jgi:hypothetical protein
MEPKFQTSFIPKKPVIQTQGLSSAPVIRTTNIFSLVSGVVFVVTMVVSGSLFFYKQLLNKQIATAGQSIEDARGAFQLDKIQELLDANSRLLAIDKLLNNHVSVSKLLGFLSEVTVKKIRLEEMTYKNEGNSPTIAMKVEAASYNALAAEGDILSKNEFIKNPFFANFSPKENGYIEASFSSNIDTTLTSYKKTIEGNDTNDTSSTTVQNVTQPAS